MDNPRDVLSSAFTVLRNYGKSTVDLELQLQDVRVLQVVGRWPPINIEIFGFGPLQETRHLLQSTQSALRLVDGESGLLGELEQLIEQVNRALALPSGLQRGSPDDRPDDRDDSLDASVVGKWPPD
jgi:hypothetical protein